MKILALDSSGLVASVAVLEDENLTAEYTIQYKKTHSQTLLPMLDEISRMIELDLSTLDAIAVAAGPGSFTGLRIGCATAKGLGQALNKPLIGIPTVDAMAYNLYGCTKLICPLMDARRNQAYTGLYTFVRKEGAYQLQVVKEQCAVPLEEILQKINEQGKEVIFLGDGVPVFRKQIEELMQGEYSFAPASCNRQRAAALGTLAFSYLQQGKIEKAEDHKPDYLRMSQAERERKEKRSLSGDKN
ncbi:MAG: tRNA (adenosine(37)-N6)-threonylcarbamoyltransferase complex dimerization subunit type 1 TsaB [Lachnospiraceae bacterium]|nr:tRNA (adenosine(37)-N6)-threonylcarbamoyltransferase complex dimerization subunit type 1 TsaB [Lachnospiraceae bacterium]